MKTVKRRKLIFRKLNELWAKFWHYFWLPCLLCGKYFGGHELGYSIYNGIPKAGEPGVKTCVCPECELNRAMEMDSSDVSREEKEAWGNDWRTKIPVLRFYSYDKKGE